MYTSIVLVFTACLLGANAQGDSLNFTAVVNEYFRSGSVGSNIDYYKIVIWETKTFGGEIVVFPERALTESTKDAVVVPDPKLGVIPYRNGAFNRKNVIGIISAEAAQAKVYIVINVFEKASCGNSSKCPERGYFLYNTNVAFDRRGAVIARYRKYNVLPGEKVDKPEKPELSTFSTDFGVTFGMFTGSDIFFKSPAVDLVRQKDVKYIAFPSSLPGEFPFLTGIQVQDGWSYGMNVNVLASGENDVERGRSGTGVYVARKHKTCRMYDMDGSSFQFWGVPKEDVRPSFTPAQVDEQGLNLGRDPTIPLSRGKDLNVDGRKFEDKICHGAFCCNFDIKYEKAMDSSKYKYRAVAFQGERRFGNMTQEVAYCAAVLCTEGNCAKKPEGGNYPLKFDKIKISASFEKTNSIQFPSTLVYYNDPNGARSLETLTYDKFTFEKQEEAGANRTTVNLQSGKVSDLITFGIYSRKFN